MSDSVLLDTWDVSEAEFPLEGTREEKLKYLLRYAILAPSIRNTQPWLFRLLHGEMEMLADPTKALHVIDPEQRELVISCGVALQHFRTAARHFGYSAVTQLLPDPSSPQLLARITLLDGEEVHNHADCTFDWVSRRRTNRGPFEDREIPSFLIELLQNAAFRESAWLRPFANPSEKDSIAGLVAESDETLYASRAYRQELASWIRPNGSTQRDGIPGYALGLGSIRSRAIQIVIRNLKIAKAEAAKDREMINGSPLVAVIGTSKDDRRDWLAAGQALGATLLLARSFGIWCSYLNQPIEIAALRRRLEELTGISGYPQLMIRMGYGTEVPATPRKRVDDVLVS